MIIEIDLKHFSQSEMEELASLIDSSIDYSLEDEANQINMETVSVIETLY